MLTTTVGINQTIGKLSDSISHLETAYQLREISAGEFAYYKSILAGLIETLDRRQK